MREDLRALYGEERLPRYTSYPPSPHFTAEIGSERYAAGLAGTPPGATASLYIGYVTPDQMTPLVTFQIWMAMILGGTGKISGAVLGTLILMLLIEGARFLPDLLPFVSSTAMAELWVFVVGLALVLFTLYRPQGLMGEATRR